MSAADKSHQYDAINKEQPPDDDGDAVKATGNTQLTSTSTTAPSSLPPTNNSTDVTTPATDSTAVPLDAAVSTTTPATINNPPSSSAPAQSPITHKEELALASRVKWHTKKRDFRARAHSNPLNDGLFNPPLTPAHFRMSRLYVNPPAPHVQWCDIGCGYGGLLASLSGAFPNNTMLGLEIRDRVAEFCRRRLMELRQQYPGEYGNLWFERTNAMKFLPNYFARGSLDKLFFCYPDPHFKRKKNRQRIISTQLLAEYAYVLREGHGIAYVVTDVPELFEWMVERFEKHPLFERRPEKEHEADIVSGFVRDNTDEAHRVDKSERSKHDASFRRVVNPI